MIVYDDLVAGNHPVIADKIMDMVLFRYNNKLMEADLAEKLEND